MRVIAAVLFVLALLQGCAESSAILVGSARPAINPASVKVYSNPPPSFDVIAIVQADSGMGLTAQQSTNFAMQELRSRAAALGANGILITTTDVKPQYSFTTVGNTVHAIEGNAQVIKGQAIYVKDTKSH